MPQPLSAEPPRAADHRPSEGDVQGSGDVRLAFNWHNADRRSQAYLTSLSLRPRTASSHLPFRAQQVPSALPPSPSDNEPEREWGFTEHGVAAQPFTPKPNVISSPASNPSLKAVNRNLLRPQSPHHVPSKPSSPRTTVLCLLPLCRHLP
jgi:hypothetical protein